VLLLKAVKFMFDFGMLEDFIFEKISKTHLPGLSIAIVKDGEIVYSKGFCFRDLDMASELLPERFME
jgi:CubicO group peptidase (beta-lactamase class C family)